MSAELEVYTSPTANCRRVTAMLKACGLAYRRHRLDRAAKEHKTPEYLAINPAGPCDAVLAGSEFLAGDLSIADFALVPIAARRKDRIAEWGLTHVARWLEALSARPEVRRGLEVA